MFVRVYEKLQSLQFDIIICDEGHRLKNSSIKTTSVSKHIAKALAKNSSIKTTSAQQAHYVETSLNQH
jgi:hypothetical protein